MISNILINGTSVNISGTRFISSLDGAGSPTIEVASYARAGGEGVALGKACYRSLVISFGVIITANGDNNAAEKQRFLSLLSIDPGSSESDQKTFTFVLNNNQQLTCKAAVLAIQNSMAAADVNKSEFLIQIQTEKSYLLGASKSATLSIANLGGLQIPMSVPAAMNLNASSEMYTQLTNSGNAYSHLQATIVGPVNGFILLNQTRTQRLQCSQALSAGDTLVLDFYQRTAILKQNTNILPTISGQWWTVAPGSNNVLFAANDTTTASSATLAYNDAYLGI
ncbi:MAG: phage tail family protein [bacterium]|nr:phage tail family protein [bacterium]